MPTTQRRLVLNRETLRQLADGVPSKEAGTGVCSAPTNPDFTVPA